MQYQPMTHPGPPPPLGISHMSHSDPYAMGSGSPLSAKPRGRTHMEMETEGNLDMGHHHNQHHLHHSQQHGHHLSHPLSHQPPQTHLQSLQPPPKMQRSAYDDTMGRNTNQHSSAMPSPANMQQGVPYGGQLYASSSMNSGQLTPLHMDMRDMRGSISSSIMNHDDSESQHTNPSSAGGLGSPGMPQPMPRPRGPKLKFTPEDDALLVDLKENRQLTWKQIAAFFPGRSSGTLQVRYCTKLKAKTTQWTDETVQRLRSAINDYENDRWRIIAGKVGHGFSPVACKEKATELD